MWYCCGLVHCIYILVMQCFRVVYCGISYESLVFSQHTVHTSLQKGKTILHHAIVNTIANTIKTANTSRMMGRLWQYCRIQYTTSFLYSHWLFFLWQGINKILLLLMRKFMRLLFILEYRKCSITCKSLHSQSYQF